MSATSPAVSVILPTYNRLEWLRSAVGSVFAQTFTDWELVVADDGSGDETVAYLSGLDDPRVRVLRLAHSQNPSRVRNAAIDAARGTYLAFLDSDDVWYPQKLEAQIPPMVSSARSRWGYTGWDRIDSTGRTIPGNSLTTPTQPTDRMFDLLLTFEVIVPMPALVAERALVEEIGGFDESLLFGEFLDICLRLALRSEGLAVSEVLCSIRSHDEHYSEDRFLSQGGLLAVFDKFCEVAPSPESRRRCKHMRARAALDLAALHGARGDFRNTWHALRLGKAFSVSRPYQWYDFSKALVRPFVSSRIRTALHRLVR